MNDPAVKATHAAATKAAVRDPGVRRRTAEAAQKRWADPAYRTKLAEIRGAEGYEEKRKAAIREGLRVRRESLGIVAVPRLKRAYRVTAPDGSRFVVPTLNQFCSEIGIPYPSALAVLNGRMKSARGYAFEKIKEDRPRLRLRGVSRDSDLREL